MNRIKVDEIPSRVLVAARKVSTSHRLTEWENLLELIEELGSRKDSLGHHRLTLGSKETYKKFLFIVYENLLTQFPLCEQLWCNYAERRYELGEDASEVLPIYDQALRVLPQSIIVWKSYLTFVLTTATTEATINAFEDARKIVGHHYYAHVIYDMYLDYLHTKHMTRDYYYLLRRIIEIPLYGYSKYFAEFIHLLQEADIETIKYFISAQDLRTVCGFKWGELLIRKDNDKMDPGYRNFKSVKDRLKKIFVDAYITTQYHVYQMWQYEKDLQEPYYDPGKELTVVELNSWNSYLAYLEVYVLRDASRGRNSTVSELHKSILKSVYERCLVRTADYSFFWIKYSNLQLNMGKFDIAKQILMKAVAYVNDSDFKLHSRLIDLEMLTGKIEEAEQLALDCLKKYPNSLHFTLRVIELENMRDPSNVLKLCDLKLKEVKGTKYDNQFDLIFRELLSYESVKLDELAKFFASYEGEKKNSYQYLRALLDFYKCYNQDKEKYRHATQLVEECTDKKVRSKLMNFIREDEKNEYF